MRLFVLNFAGACFLAWAAWLGHLQFVFANDSSRISYLVAALLVVILWGAISGRVKWRETVAVAEWMVTLGLVGTVVGLVHIMQGIDSTTLRTPDGLASTVANMVAGMGTAFLSTLTGSVCALWLSVNMWVAPR